MISALAVGAEPDAEIFVGLLVAAAVLTEVAHRLRMPYPVVLVLAGLGLGFVPGLPAPSLDPDLFFFFFLPPLVYAEAVRFPIENIKFYAAEIGLLAVGLVVATTVAVAGVAHAVLGLPWAAAFVLGAVVGPTDPISATAVLRRLGVTPRLEAILGAEALINDGTALVAYKLAVAAAGAHAVSLGYITVEAVWIALGGVAVGTAVGRAWTLIRRWTTVPDVEITFSVVMPFAAYFPAERLGVSGVLAAVVAGMLVGRQLHEIPPATRLQGHAFWDVTVHLLNSMLFLLVGLTFPEIVERLSSFDRADLVWGAVAVVATVIVLRLLWMPLVRHVGTGGRRARAERMQNREMLVLGWTGMRGGVSLAAALSVPATVAGHAFPGRDQIIFTTYMVLLATLVIPGLTLGPLIQLLGIGAGEAQARRDDRARAHILHAALEHIEQLIDSGELPDEIGRRLIDLYQARLDRLEPIPRDVTPDLSEAMRRAQQGAVAAQRAVLAELEDGDEIGSASAEDIERELDREAAALR